MEASRIGPNAVTRLAEAVTERFGAAETAALFRAAGLFHHFASPPERMVAEADVVALHRTLAARFPAEAEAIAADAGARTGAYLLANRIPKPVQAVLRVAPPWVAAKVLLAAVAKNAWTFAGSGAFEAHAGGGADVAVRGGPFADPREAAAPLRAFYAAVFAHLFRALVSPRTTAAAETGGGACAIRLAWRRAAPPLPTPAQAR
jgi:divinyl protochlorophyllide a 8-vinyl-reductase